MYNNIHFSGLNSLVMPSVRSSVLLVHRQSVVSLSVLLSVQSIVLLNRRPVRVCSVRRVRWAHARPVAGSWLSAWGRRWGGLQIGRDRATQASTPRRLRHKRSVRLSGDVLPKCCIAVFFPAAYPDRRRQALQQLAAFFVL